MSFEATANAEQAQPSSPRDAKEVAGSVSPFDRLYAAGYDYVTARHNRRGGDEHRRRLVEDAQGEVLEVGAGTGWNLPHYRAASRVVALEPHPGMRARAERRARRAAVPVEVIDGDGMALPFPDDSFDTVVFGFVLCTIPDPARALAEGRRVVRPSGQVRFVEHVRATDPKLARWQDRVNPLWQRVAGGCRANQDTAAMIPAAGLEIERLERCDCPATAPRFCRPHIWGEARLAAREGAPGA